MEHERYTIVVFIIVTTAFILALVAMLIALVYMYQKKHLLYYLQMNTFKAKHDKSLMTARLEMQELTFQQISREIHDNIKLSLTFSKLNLHTLNRQDERDMEIKINTSIDLIAKAIKDLNHLSQSLNTDWIKGQGLINALEKEIDKLRITGLYAIEINISGNHFIMEAERELMVFRVVQEVFNNIIKHAQAKSIRFSLQYYDDHACVIISDDGIGFDYSIAENTINGTGLNNINIRAQVLNGKVSITTAPGQGTAICLVVPYGS